MKSTNYLLITVATLQLASIIQAATAQTPATMSVVTASQTPDISSMAKYLLKTRDHALAHKHATPQLTTLCEQIEKGATTVPLTLVEDSLEEAISSLALIPPAEAVVMMDKLTECIEDMYSQLEVAGDDELVTRAAVKTFRSVNVQRRLTTTYLVARRNALIENDLTVGGTLTLLTLPAVGASDTPLSINSAGVITRGSASSGGSSSLCQAGPVNVGTSDATAVSLVTNGCSNSRLSIDANGAVTIAAPTTGTALTITAATNTRAFDVIGNGTAYAARITAGNGSGGALTIIGGTGFAVPLQVSSSAGTGTAATFVGNANAPAVGITGNGTAGALVLINSQPSDPADNLLTIGGDGTVKQSTTTLSQLLINGCQAGPIDIGTSGTQQIRLSTNNRCGDDNNASILINGTSGQVIIQQVTAATTPLFVAGGSEGGGAPIAIFESLDDTPGNAVSFNSGPVVNGLTATGATALYINASNQISTLASSKRFKENFREIEDISSKTYALHPLLFDYKAENGGTRDQAGFIAEEVAELFPSLINYETDGTPHSIKYECFHALAIKEIQKHQARLEAQENTLQKLQERLVQQDVTIQVLLKAIQTLNAKQR